MRALLPLAASLALATTAGCAHVNKPAAITAGTALLVAGAASFAVGASRDVPECDLEQICLNSADTAVGNQLLMILGGTLAAGGVGTLLVAAAAPTDSADAAHELPLAAEPRPAGAAELGAACVEWRRHYAAETDRQARLRLMAARPSACLAQVSARIGGGAAADSTMTAPGATAVTPSGR